MCKQVENKLLVNKKILHNDFQEDIEEIEIENVFEIDFELLEIYKKNEEGAFHLLKVVGSLILFYSLIIYFYKSITF